MNASSHSQRSISHLAPLFDSLVAASLDLVDLTRWTASGRHAGAGLRLRRAAYRVHAAAESFVDEVSQ